MSRDFIVGWRKWNDEQKKQHLCILGYDGDPLIYCCRKNIKGALEDNQENTFLEHADLKPGGNLPKCRTCQKEAHRLEGLGLLVEGK